MVVRWWWLVVVIAVEEDGLNWRRPGGPTDAGWDGASETRRSIGSIETEAEEKGFLLNIDGLRFGTISCWLLSPDYCLCWNKSPAPLLFTAREDEEVEKGLGNWEREKGWVWG